MRGIKTDEEGEALATDAINYDLHILAITETHSEEDTYEDITIKDENGTIHKYLLYATNKTGLLIRKDLNPTIKKITDRICTAKIQLKDHNLLFISAYAHTLEKSEKEPNLREEFYEALEAVIEKAAKRDLLIIGGHFNAKTGSGYKEFPQNMGNFGKGIMNSSGKRLLETCKGQNLLLTNTLFQHKKAHRTTWEAPFRNFITRSGEERRNPVRNQIDYIITRAEHRKNLFVTNARSYGGIWTDTDHKLVMTKFKIEWYKIKNRKEKEVKIELSNFYCEDKKVQYQVEVRNNMEKIEQQNTAQEKWNAICTVCKEAGEKVLGTKNKAVDKKDSKAQEISTEIKKMNKEIDSTTGQEAREKKKEKRNQLKAKLRARLKEIEERKLEKKLEEIENSRNDSNRYYKAIKEIRRLKKIEPLTVENEDGEIATTEEEQVKIVMAYFEKMLAPETDERRCYKPSKIRIPFTAEEIRKILRKMKNGKSAGIDKLEVEFLKYAPMEILEQVADILNTTTNTEEELQELVVGLLRPL